MLRSRPPDSRCDDLLGFQGGAVAVFAIADGEQAYEAKFQSRRLASLKETARSLGYTLVEDPMAAS